VFFPSFLRKQESSALILAFNDLKTLDHGLRRADARNQSILIG